MQNMNEVKFSFSFNGDQRNIYKPLKGMMDVTVTSTLGTATTMNAELYLVRYMKKRDATKLFFRYKQVEVQDWSSVMHEETLPQTVSLSEADMIPIKLMSYEG